MVLAKVHLLVAKSSKDALNSYPKDVEMEVVLHTTPPALTTLEQFAQALWLDVWTVFADYQLLAPESHIMDVSATNVQTDRLLPTTMTACAQVIPQKSNVTMEHALQLEPFALSRHLSSLTQ